MNFIATIMKWLIIGWLAFWGVIIVIEIVSIGGIAAFMSLL